MDDTKIDFTLQRMTALMSKNPGVLLERAIATAMHDFPVVLEKRTDSLVGRGHHESYHLYVPSRRIVCFLWDEDHDERAFIAAGSILRRLNGNGQCPILMFAERKGKFTVVTTNENAKRSLELNIDGNIDAGGDVWPVEIVTSGPEVGSKGIINADPEETGPYLMNLLETRKALSCVWECLELRDMEVRARRSAQVNSIV